MPILRQSGSKRAAHGARRALHTSQSCYNPATIVADCGFRLDPTAILLQSRSIAARLHHLGPQSCHNRAPIVHQSSVHSARGGGVGFRDFSRKSPVHPIEPQSCTNRMKCFLDWSSIVGTKPSSRDIQSDLRSSADPAPIRFKACSARRTPCTAHHAILLQSCSNRCRLRFPSQSDRNPATI